MPSIIMQAVVLWLSYACTSAHIQFTDCGGASAVLHFTDVVLSPSTQPVPLGQHTVFRKEGNASRRVDRVAMRDAVAVRVGHLPLLHLWNISIDPCHGIFKETECPIQPGTFDFQINVSLPVIMPVGEFIDRQLFTDADSGAPLGCVQFEFNTTRHKLPAPARASMTE